MVHMDSWRFSLWISASICVICSLSHSSPISREPQNALTAPFVAEIFGCKVNCTGVRLRRVCGSDGITYQSKCHAKQMRKCQGHDVQVAATGSCRGVAAGQLTKCQQDRMAALAKLSSIADDDVFVPECSPDGSFARIQCHAATGYCWCVSRRGKPLASTSVHGRNKVQCRPHKSGADNRPNSSRKVSRNDRSSSRDRSCSGSDRSLFNANLIGLFSEEYDRFPKPSPPSYPGAPKDLPIESKLDSLLDTAEKRVIEWKFSELDTNEDSALTSIEVRGLRDIVKSLVRPKPCARDFLQFCDLNQDEQIERDEWSVCLGVDLHMNGHRNKGSKHKRNRPKNRKKGAASGPQIFSNSRPDSGSTSHDSFLSLAVNQDETNVNEPNTAISVPETPSDAASARDCLSDHIKAKEMDMKDPESGIFIPECMEGSTTADGRVLYRQEQCHKATKYCWCVDQETGFPIPGTSTHNVMPDCDNIKTRQFKGCPFAQKKRFLQQLLDQLSTQMVEHASNVSTGSAIFEPNPEHTLEERAARWKLAVMDSNNNQILERKELKDFKKEIQRTKLLRKCGRNFVKFCDGNNDNKVTLDEWIQCLGLNDDDQQSSLPVNPKRQGPNPFKKFLRDS